MKKTGMILLAMVLCLNVFSQNKPAGGTVKKIIVDAGHGGSDGGAKGMVTNEATITLQVSLKLAKALREAFPEVSVLETRTNTAFPGNTNSVTSANHWRADFANKSGAELFISLHCNAAGRRPGGWYEKRVSGREARTRTVKKGKKRVQQTYYVNTYEDVWVENKAKGTETLIWAVDKNNAKVNSIKNNEDYYEEGGDHDDDFKMPNPNDPAEKARMLIYAQNYFRKSYMLAALMEKEFVADGRVSRGVKQRNEKGIWVLQATGMPSILIEMGFISNKEEEEYLMSDAGQQQMVESIVSAVRTYLTKPVMIIGAADSTLSQ